MLPSCAQWSILTLKDEKWSRKYFFNMIIDYYLINLCLIKLGMYYLIYDMHTFVALTYNMNDFRLIFTILFNVLYSKTLCCLLFSR